MDDPVAYERETHYLLWTRAARYTYDAGVLLLLVGLATVLVPQDSNDAARWAAAGIAGLAAIGELVWIVHAAVVSRRRLR